jgi:hypothetical protein
VPSLQKLHKNFRKKFSPNRKKILCVLLKWCYLKTMKRNKNQITITVIIICLACAVSGLADSPKIPNGVQLDYIDNSEAIGCNKDIPSRREVGSNMSLRPPKRIVDLACSCGKCQNVLLVSGQSSSLKSGDPKHTAKTAIVSYINRQNPVNLHDVAKDLSFLLGIEISIDKNKVDKFTETFKKEMARRHGDKVAERVLSWEIKTNSNFGMNLGKEHSLFDNTGLAVIESLARKFGMTIQWTESGAVLAPNSNYDFVINSPLTD